MKNIIKKIVANLIKRAELNTQANTFLLFSDRQLEDIGLSRTKLEQGAKAYPWAAKTQDWRMDTISNDFKHLTDCKTSTVQVAVTAQNDTDNPFNSPKAA